MADGTVSGRFDLEARSAIGALKSIRDEGAAADTALKGLGSTMDTLGGVQSDTRLASYKRKLGDVAKAAETTATKVAASWDAQAKAIDVAATKIEGRIDRLQGRLDRYGRSRSSAEISLSGFDRVNAQLSQVEARLDSIARRNATARVSMGGGGFAGGGLSSAASAGGGGLPGGFGGRLLLGALGLSPGILGLAGGATALAGSATSAALGAGAIGLGAYGTLGAGAALSAAGIVPAVHNLTQLTQAQQKYTAAVQEFGRASTQAAAAKRSYDAAIAQGTPAEVSAATQIGLLRRQFTRSTAAGQRSVYRAAGTLAYDARSALRNGVGSDINAATGATAGAATSFGGFLTNPQSLRTLQTLTGSFVGNLPQMESSLEHVATILENLAVDAIPFFSAAVTWVDHWTAGMAQSSGDTHKVSSDIGSMVDSLKDWGRLGGAVFDTVKDIFAAGTPTGNSMVVQLTDTFRQWDTWIQNNPGKVSAWFTQAATTTDHIANTVKTLVTDVFKLATRLMPVFDRAMDLVNVIGGGGLPTILTAAGFTAARRGGLSPGRLVSGTVLGSPSLIASGTRRGPAVTEPSTGGGGRTSGRATNYETATGRTTDGVHLMPGASEGPQAVIERRARAQEERSSGFRDRVRRRVSSVTESSPTAGRISDTAGAGARGIKRLGDEAVRAVGPILAISGALEAMSTKGTLLDKLGGFVHGASGGLVPASPTIGAATVGGAAGLAAGGPAGGIVGALTGALFAQFFGSSKQGTLAGDPAFRRSLNRLGPRAARVDSLSDLRSFNAAANAPGIEMTLGGGNDAVGDPKDIAKIAAYLQRVSKLAVTQAATGASQAWTDAFTTGVIQHGKDPVKAAQTIADGMAGQIEKLGPHGGRILADTTAQWVAKEEQEYPKLKKPLDKMMDQITQTLQHTYNKTNGTLGDIQQRFVYYNGQIYDGTQQQWKNISKAMTDPVMVAQEKMEGTFGTIKKEAIASLESMGLDHTAAAALVTRPQAANSFVRTYNQGQAGTAQHAPGRRATGGMIPGDGLLDTVGFGGAQAAPGEAWIANRHTMNELSRSTLATHGKTAWQMIRDEGRPHSAPFARGGDLGGTLGGGGVTSGSVAHEHPELHSGIAQATQDLLDKFPALHISSTTGGTHVPNSYHYLGEATDTSGDSATMLAAAAWIKASGLAKGLTEGIHNPNLAVYHGAIETPPGPFGAVWAGHLDHIHMAVAGALNAAVNGAAGIGSGVAPGLGQVNLKVPKISDLGGVPLALASMGASTYARTLSAVLNASPQLAGGGGGNVGLVPGGGAVVAQIGRELMANGLNRVGAAGIIGNALQESGWNPASVGSGGGGLWGFTAHPNSLSDLQAFAAGEHMPWTNPKVQTQFLLDHMSRGDITTLNSQGSAAAAASWFMNNWEHPLAATENEARRQQGAVQAFNMGYSRGGPIAWGGWNARGASFRTNGPTLFGAGEGGKPEHVSITPAGSAGGITVNMYNPTIGSHGEARKLGALVAQEIIDAMNRVGNGASDAQLMGADA